MIAATPELTDFVNERLFPFLIYGLIASITLGFIAVHFLVRAFVRDGISISPRYSRYQFPLDLRAWKTLCRARGCSFGAQPIGRYASHTAARLAF
jgi:hypothetical protein